MTTMEAITQVRHAEERGNILRVLKQEYNTRMTGVKTIANALDALDFPVSTDGLIFHLNYLESRGYVKIWRFRDMPGWRDDRAFLGSPDEIRFARMEAHGLHLHDGHIAADPMVRF